MKSAHKKRTRKPVHPGRVFKLDVLEPLNITLTTAAKALGISRKHLSNFANEQVPCSKDLARRLAIATKTSVTSWLNMQTAIDVWEAEHAEKSVYASVRSFSQLAA